VSDTGDAANFVALARGHGHAISNGSTFAPPAIAGFDGSKCSRNSRFWTSARKNEGILQAITLPKGDVEKGIAEIAHFYPSA
jgi:hypothetical protein